MKEQGLWGHFDDLVGALKRRIDAPDFTNLHSQYQDLIGIFASDIADTPKIFYPFSGNVISDMGDIDDAVKPLIRLPYPRTFFLTQAPYGESVVLATDLGIVCEDSSDLHPEGSIGFTTALRTVGGWMVLPVLSIFCPSGAGIPGVNIKVVENGMEADLVSRYVPKHIATENGEDPVRRLRRASNIIGVSTIVNACVLLNTHNTTQETVKAPKFLNQKRVKKGKRPLLDYKILVVDGERWDSNDAARAMVHGDGSGVRSHLRRGHIRHLANGKIAYVRATYVHGSKEGFIEKDYFIGDRHAIRQQA